jgi:hypothetical protein
MASEKEIIITFLFNRSGKSKLSYNEIYLTLSMQLNWFTPDDAKLFINQTIEEDLLKKEKDLLIPSFDYRNIVVPVGFSPSKMVFKEKTEIPKKKEKELIKKMLNILSEKTKVNEEEILSKIKKLENEKNITIEVAALLIGKEYNVNLKDYFDEIELSIFED